MIYNRWGTPIKIEGNCGPVTPREFNGPVTLLQVRDITQVETTTEYEFAEFLRADNGCTEIIASIQLAPNVHLNGADLSSAILQAL